MEDHLRPLTEAMGGGLWEWDCRRIMERVREGNVHPPPSALSTLIAIFSAVGEGRKEKNTFLRMASISISYWLVYLTRQTYFLPN